MGGHAHVQGGLQSQELAANSARPPPARVQRVTCDRDQGVCATEAPALVVREGRTVLARSGREVWEVVAALQRGEGGVDAAEARLVEAYYERHPDEVDALIASARG